MTCFSFSTSEVKYLSYALIMNTFVLHLSDAASVKLQQELAHAQDSPQKDLANAQDINSLAQVVDAPELGLKAEYGYVDRLVNSVIIQRHCVRSSTTYPPEVWGGMPAKYTKSLADFTSYAWPDAAAWGVEAGECTPIGKELTVKLGRAFVDMHAQPFKFVVDVDSARDNTTADMLVEGLRQRGVSSSSDYQAIFAGNSQCKTNQSVAKLLEGTLQQLERFPAPPEHAARIELVQQMLGSKGKFNLVNLKDRIQRGEMTGQTKVATTATEVFVMERMSGMLSAWGQATDAQILDMQMTNNLYWHQHYSDYMASRDVSTLLYEMGRTLFGPTAEETAGTTVFVGHDANIEAIGQLLDLRYVDPRYGNEAAAPMSRLVFNLYEDSHSKTDHHGNGVENRKESQRYVSARFYSASLDGNVAPDDGVEVTFLGAQRLQRISEKAFKTRVTEMLNPDCM